MTSWYTSRDVRACERDSISPGPLNKVLLSDRPLGWDTNHGWCIKTRLTFIFSGCALVFPYVSASLPLGIFDGLVFVCLTGPHALPSFIWCDIYWGLLREATFTWRSTNTKFERLFPHKIVIYSLTKKKHTTHIKLQFTLLYTISCLIELWCMCNIIV